MIGNIEPPYIEVWKDNKRRKFYLSKKPFYLTYDNEDFKLSYNKENNSQVKVSLLEGKVEIRRLQGNRWDLKYAEIAKDLLSLKSGEFFSFKSYDFFVELHHTDIPFVFTGQYNESRFVPMLESARTDEPIIITGDTGVGKELFAKNIHYNSHRKHMPLYILNGDQDSESIEATLFGVKKGAYTGAKEDRKGLFKLANGGTIIIDNIDLLTYKTQVALLRALQNKEVQALGASKPFIHNVRIIGISNKSFYELLADTNIRRDLFYRLESTWVNIPLLKDRVDELEDLISLFSDDLAYIDIEELKQYSWPGNIRELKNYIEKVQLLGRFVKISKIKDKLAWKNSFGKKLNLNLLEFNKQYLMLKQIRDSLDGAKI